MYCSITNKIRQVKNRTCNPDISRWGKKKNQTQNIANLYQEINIKKSIRMCECATDLVFAVDKSKRIKLHKANFCRVRLCPMCTWRRSLKIFGQVSEIMSCISGKYMYLFLTLTIKNVNPDDLSECLDELGAAWKRIVKYKKWTNTVKGYFKTLEITHNVDPTSLSYDTYHPHLHVLVAVESDYYDNDKIYINYATLRQMWGKALKVNYEPQVYMQSVSGTDLGGVAEVTKYAVKYKDIVTDDYRMSIKTLSILDIALHKRRFVSFGGIFKDIHHRLEMSAPEDIDPSHEAVEDALVEVLAYRWHIGYSSYMPVLSEA
jgi:Plasmid rolling circle replication initiator protein and truncated derivatives